MHVERHSESSLSSDSSLSSSPSDSSALGHRRVQPLRLNFPTLTSESDSSGSGSSIRSIYKRAHHHHHHGPPSSTSTSTSTDGRNHSLPGGRRPPKLSLDTKNCKALPLPALACATAEHSPLGAFSPTTSARVHLRSVVDNNINRIAHGPVTESRKRVGHSPSYSITTLASSNTTFRRLRTSSLRSFTLPWTPRPASTQTPSGRSLKKLFENNSSIDSSSPSVSETSVNVNVPSISRSPSPTVSCHSPPGLSFTAMRFDGDSSYQYSEIHNVTSMSSYSTYGLATASSSSQIEGVGASTNRARPTHARFHSTPSASTVAHASTLLPPPVPLSQHSTLKLPGPNYRSKVNDAKSAHGRNRSRSRSRSRSPGSTDNYNNSARPSSPSSNQQSSSTCAGLAPALAAVERASRLRVACVCGVCGREGADYPRCPRCDIAWCSRECRVGGSGGAKRHVCKAGVPGTGANALPRSVSGLGRERVRTMSMLA